MVKMRLLLGDMLPYEIYTLHWNVIQMSEMITFLVLKHWDVLFPCVCVQDFPCSVTKSYPTLCYYIDCSMSGFLSFTISLSLLKLMSIESVIPWTISFSDAPSLLATVFPIISAFSNELAFHIRCSKYWSFNISPSIKPGTYRQNHMSIKWNYSSCGESGRNEVNGSTCHYSCLENPMDSGAWWARVQGIGKKTDTN